MSMNGHRPFAIAIATSLRVDYVEARLTGEVFQVLYPDPRKLRSRLIRSCIARSLAINIHKVPW